MNKPDTREIFFLLQKLNKHKNFSSLLNITQALLYFVHLKAQSYHSSREKFILYFITEAFIWNQPGSLCHQSAGTVTAHWAVK